MAEMEKITAFFLSVLMFFGVFGGVIEVKNQVEIGILSFSDADISEGYVADVPFSDGSADPGANSTNYVAPVGVLKLDFDEPFTYNYFITAGKSSEIRSTFRNYAGAAGGAKE